MFMSSYRLLLCCYSPHVVTHEGGHHVPATGVPKASVLAFLQQMQVELTNSEKIQRICLNIIQTFDIYPKGEIVELVAGLPTSLSPLKTTILDRVSDITGKFVTSIEIYKSSQYIYLIAIVFSQNKELFKHSRPVLLPAASAESPV